MTAGADAAPLVPTPAPGVALVEEGDQAALVAPTGVLLALDDPARLLWQLFDGAVTLGELADDVVAVFEGAVRERVLDDLVRFHDTLLVHGLLVPPDGPPAAAPRADTVALPPPCCGNRLDEESWRVTLACRVGARLIGVRTQHAAVEAALVDLLGPMVEGIDLDDVPPNLSLVLRPPHGGQGPPGERQAAAPALELHSQQRLITSSGSAARVRVALGIELAVLAGSPDDALHLDVVAIGRPEGVALLPTAVHRPALRFLWSGLGERGLAVGPARAAVDVDRRELVVPSVGWPSDAGATARFDQLVDWPHAGPDLLTPGRYPVRAVGLGPPEGDVPSNLVEALRPLVALLATVEGDDFPARLDAARELVAVAGVGSPAPGDLLGWLDHHLDPHR